MFERSRAVRVLIAGGVFATGLGLSLPAYADFAESDYSDYAAPTPERRSGFTFGLDYGGGFSTIEAYPNKLNEINDPAFKQSITGAGGGGALWLGAALRDWFTFSIGYGLRGGGDEEKAGGSGAILFRVEGFPLFYQGGRWRDVGVMGEFGAGSGAIARVEDKKVLAEAGSMSSVAFGVFYEPWQFWNFSAGPVLRYGHDFSESWSAHTASIGLRLAFYGTQPD